jgi:hypothetical protein
MDVWVSEIPQSVAIVLRLYFRDNEFGLVGGLAAL